MAYELIVNGSKSWAPGHASILRRRHVPDEEGKLMPHTELVEDRLRFLEIDQDVVTELQRARQYIEPELDGMLERFYVHMMSDRATAALFDDNDTVDRARSSQRKHWLDDLFGGRFSNAFFEKAERIGRTHARIGLEPRWYLGGYARMMSEFIDCISEKAAREGRDPRATIQAVCKAVLLDIDLVIYCYLEAKDATMRQVLGRATNFASDVTELSRQLSEITGGVERAAAALSETGRGGDSAQVDELRQQIVALRRQSGEIERRVNELQFGDRLYIAKRSSITSRLKALLRLD